MAMSPQTYNKYINLGFLNANILAKNKSGWEANTRFMNPRTQS